MNIEEMKLVENSLKSIADALPVADVTYWGPADEIKKKLLNQGFENVEVKSTNISIKEGEYEISLTRPFQVDGKTFLLDEGSEEVVVKKNGQELSWFDFISNTDDSNIKKAYNVLEDIRIEKEFKGITQQNIGNVR